MRYLLLAFLLFSSLFCAQTPQLLLLKTYKDQNITGWLVSEKLDGIRAYWDGKKLMSRSGKTIHAPKWFLANYPPFAIDGELWSKRSDFENISSIVRDKNPSSSWREISHHIFDVPDARGGLSERLVTLKSYENEQIKIIKQHKIYDKSDLLEFLKAVESRGGEGVVVRDPNAAYIKGRSDQVLKVKSFLDDECRVLGYTRGRGKYEGKVGALHCELKNGVTFKIGSGLSDEDRLHPPKVGEIVSFKYKELTKYKKPRFPSFLRLRYSRDEIPKDWVKTSKNSDI